MPYDPPQEDVLTVTKEGFIATVTINRPEVKNAVNPAVADGLIETLRAAGADPEVKVMILTGAGNVFTAGVDLGCLLKRDQPDNHRMLYERLPIMVSEFIKFPKPLIIAVNGIGIGFGATVAGIGDLTVMDETARLRTPFTSLGVVPEVAATYQFPALMGRQNAAWMLMSSEWMSAQECKDMGLVRELAPAGEALKVAQERAATLAALPSSSLMRTKELMMAPHLDALLKANEVEFEHFWASVEGPASKEAINAFLEKRAPDFSAF